MIGKRVQLRPSYAKWHLDHPEVYGYMDDFETETLMHLMCCMGVPMEGRIIRKGMDCWFVSFRIGNLKTQYFVDRKDLIWLR